MKVFQYETNRIQPKFRKKRLQAPSAAKADPTPLTGLIKGKQATDIEERFGRALASLGLEFRFQVRFRTVDSLPGREKEVDFVVENGLSYPVDIDCKIGHYTAAQRGRDRIREVLLNEVFVRRGMALLQRIAWYQLETQEQAEYIVRRLFYSD